jgi:hypothetical protein
VRIALEKKDDGKKGEHRRYAEKERTGDEKKRTGQHDE